jgi:hypothetical protein
MPVPATIDDLSTTESSNFPAGTETPKSADNYLRAHASFIAQLRDEKTDIADLASTASGDGAGLSGFDWAVIPAAISKADWGIQTAATGYNVLRQIIPSYWADLFAGTSVTDFSTEVQAAIDSVGDGGEVFFPLFPAGLKAQGLQMRVGTTLRGSGRHMPTIVGDGTAPVIKTNDWALSSAVRNIAIYDLQITNSNYPAVQLWGSPDSSIQRCTLSVVGATALSSILSVRCKINGNRILSSGDVYAATFLNYCNGTDASANTISGGTAGSGVLVGRTTTINLDNTINEVGGGVGISAASSYAFGAGFADASSVTITAVDGSGTGATGTVTVVRGIVTAVSITSGGSGYTNGERVYIKNAGNTQVWGVALATVVAGAVTALVDDCGGNVSGLSMRGFYAEQVRRPMELGLRYSVIGCDFTGATFGNSGVDIVAARDSAIHIGRATNVVADGFYPIGSGTENLFEWYDVTAGAGAIPYLEGSRILCHYLSGYAATFSKNAAFVSSNDLRIYGKNEFRIASSTPIGIEREWISPLMTANVSFTQSEAVPLTTGGGIVTAVDVIDKNGTITCTVSIGSTVSISEVYNGDPEGLTYSNRASRAVNEAAAKFIRPGYQLLFRVIAGVGTGTFRVRVRYRA